MKKIIFVDREAELDFLKKAYSERKRQLIVIYGRRRVGKSELITFFLKDKPHLYFLADKRGTENNAKRFAARCGEYFGEPPPSVENFDDAFRYLKGRMGKERFAVAIDEFSYLVEKDDSIPSVFQLIWDSILPDTAAYLILCGSSISMMYEGALSYKSPLYGRRTGHWKLSPLEFTDVLKFFPKKSFEEVVQFYAVFGNIPAYLAMADPSKSLEKNIVDEILKKGGKLYNEPEFLLKEELREPSTYNSIFEAMATNSKLTDIANKAKVPAKDLPKYFAVLQNLELIERITPVTKKKGKKSLYRIRDNFFAFWFRFVFPYKSKLEERKHEEVAKKIKTNLNDFVGRKFENICLEAMTEPPKGEPFSFEKLGRWWGSYRDEKGERKTAEIDIVGVNEKEKKILFGECKWSEKVDANKVLGELKKKTELVDWCREERKEYYAVFAKSFKKRIKEENVLLFDLKDLERIFRS